MRARYVIDRVLSEVDDDQYVKMVRVDRQLRPLEDPKFAKLCLTAGDKIAVYWLGKDPSEVHYLSPTSTAGCYTCHFEGRKTLWQVMLNAGRETAKNNTRRS
jgi:hypothetical protein